MTLPYTGASGFCSRYNKGVFFLFLSADLIHAAASMASLIIGEFPVPLRFFQNGGFYFGEHSCLIQTLDGNLIRRMQTRFYLSVRRDADTVALCTEMGTYRTD